MTDEDDVVVYELTIAAKGKSTEVVMSPNGKVLEGDDEDEDGEKGEKKAKKKEKDEDDVKGEKKEKPKD